MSSDDLFEPLRRQLMSEVAAQLTVLGAQLGCRMLSERVMQAMERVPRHEFVPAEVKPFAYMNTPLPIGCGKTISQPFIVALMTELLALEPEAPCAGDRHRAGLPGRDPGWAGARGLQRRADPRAVGCGIQTPDAAGLWQHAPARWQRPPGLAGARARSIASS